VNPATAQQLTSGMAAHGQWKVQLSDSIGKGAADLDPASIRRDDECPFGQWLHGLRDPAVTSDGHWETTMTLHAQLHSSMAQLVTMSKSGKTAEAVAGMGLGQNFSKISSQFTREIMAWRDGK